MRLWCQAPVVAALLIFLQIALSDARHLCITVDGECDSSNDVVSTTCSNEDTDEIVAPIFTSGSGSEHENSHCYTLESALMGMRSRDTLLLSPGTHVLSASAVSVVSNLSDISIVGNLSNHDKVVIACAKGVGLSFVNISRLTLFGFTIDDCHLHGSKAMIFDHLNVLFSYPIVHDLVGGVFLLYCSDLTVENVTVGHSHGFGMIGWNLLGDAKFRGVNLLSNSPKSCIFELDDHHDTTVGKTIGGGGFFLYQDFEDNSVMKFSDNSLSFDRGLIADNFGCQQGLGSSIFNELFRQVASSVSNQYIGSAGGLSIVFGQSSYHVNATIRSYTFCNNTNLYGGGGMMVLLYELANKSDVHIINSTFMDNGATLRNKQGEIMQGREGGIFILYYVPILNVYQDQKLLLNYLRQLPSKVHIHDSIFINNSAQIGGGICVLSFGASQNFVQDQLNINNCTFVSNRAEHGSAIYAKEITYSGFEKGLKFSIQNINVTGNRGTLQAVSLNQLNVSFSGTNIFMSNMVTAMSLQKSIVIFSGSNLFKQNIGSRGGALHLKTSESYIIVRNETNVLFIENEGIICGGAIYAEFDTNVPIRYDCFLFIEEFNPLCHVNDDCVTYTVNVDFTNNTSPLGSAIYGSTLYHCAWSNGVHFIYLDDRSAHDIVEDTIDSLQSADSWLHFNPSVSQINVINTIPQFIISTLSHRHNFDLNFNVTPGGHFTLHLKAFDHLLQPIPLTILSHVTAANTKDISTATSSVGETNRYLLVGSDEYTEVPVHVYGQQDTTYTVSIESIESHIKLDVTVWLRNCSTGFRFNNDPQFPGCECDIRDNLTNVDCNDDGTVTHAYNEWIGWSDSSQYIQHDCIHNYCDLNVTNVDLGFPDDQCANNRAGIICGGCRPGYSRLLGSTTCRVCPNSNLLWFALISLFMILGIVLVALVKYFNITITDGYINGFIFYANIVNIYFNSLPVDQIQVMAPLYALMAFLNLNFGIEVCFYHGMTQLGLVGLTLTFPIYLLFILLVIVLFTEYVSIHLRKLRKWINQRKRNARVSNEANAMTVDNATEQSSNLIQVLVTLLIISYTSLIQICFNIIEFVVIKTPSGSYVGWGGDPNWEYFTDVHIPLFFVAIGLLFVLVPFAIMITFPNRLLSWRLTHKLKPFVDALTAPFAEKRQFWLGFRLLCRLSIYFLVTLRSGTYRYLLLALILLFILVLQACLWPYKSTGRNLLDLSLMVNLTFLAVITIYVQPLDEIWSRNILILFTLMPVIELFLVICYYICSKFSFVKKMYESIKKRADEIVNKVTARSRGKTSKRKKRTIFQAQNSVAKRDAITHWSLRLDRRASHVLRESMLEETTAF